VVEGVGASGVASALVADSRGRIFGWFAAQRARYTSANAPNPPFFGSGAGVGVASGATGFFGSGMRRPYVAGAVAITPEACGGAY